MLAPPMTVKYLFDAEPGELVRTNGAKGPLLGLVSGIHFKDSRFEKLLICLVAADEQHRGPCYMPVHQHAQETALSFGRDYLFVADPAPDAIDPIWGSGYYAPGAIIVGEQKRILQVAPAFTQAHHSMLSYDIDAGSTVSAGEERPGCVILKWEIRLKRSADLDPPLPPLFRFEVASRSLR